MPLTFVLLGVAFVAVWGAAATSWRATALWQLLLLGACLAALYEGLMTWQGVPLVAALWLTARQYERARDRRARLAWGTVAVAAAAALATHRMPGFGAHTIAENIRLSASSAPMTLQASFDKGFAGVVLLAQFCRRSRTLAEWGRAIGVGLLIGTATAGVVIGLAIAAGAVRFDPKLPALMPAWMAANLFLTCIFEESLFRGVLQDRLTRWLGQRPRWSWAPLAVASVLFGLAHAGGGPVLIVVAALAGVGYGLAYAVTGRVESAVIAHFTLNSLHFIGFTYPYAVR